MSELPILSDAERLSADRGGFDLRLATRRRAAELYGTAESGGGELTETPMTSDTAEAVEVASEAETATSETATEATALLRAAGAAVEHAGQKTGLGPEAAGEVPATETLPPAVAAKGADEAPRMTPAPRLRGSDESTTAETQQPPRFEINQVVSYGNKDSKWRVVEMIADDRGETILTLQEMGGKGSSLWHPERKRVPARLVAELNRPAGA